MVLVINFIDNTYDSEHLTVEPYMNKYKFAKLKLKPGITKELIVDLFAGQTVERSQIITAVNQYHIQNGGVGPETPNLTKCIKTALRTLKKEGKADNPSLGAWVIHSMPDFVSPNPIEEFSNEESIDKVVTKQWGEKVIGVGKEAIYVYYLPSYKALAKIEDRNIWPCKIGRTEQDPIYRILSQLSTALPEIPCISLILKTDESRKLESALHLALSSRNKKINDAPGDEWFLTSPDEVESIAIFICPNLYQQDQIVPHDINAL